MPLSSKFEQTFQEKIEDIYKLFNTIDANYKYLTKYNKIYLKHLMDTFNTSLEAGILNVTYLNYVINKLKGMIRKQEQLAEIMHLIHNLIRTDVYKYLTPVNKNRLREIMRTLDEYNYDYNDYIAIKSVLNKITEQYQSSYEGSAIWDSYSVLKRKKKTPFNE